MIFCYTENQNVNFIDDFRICYNFFYSQLLKLVEFETVKIILSLKFVKRVAVNKSTTSDWLIFKKQNNDLTIAQELRNSPFKNFQTGKKIQNGNFR